MTLISLFFVLHFIYLFISCRLSWLPIGFLLHVKYTLSYHIVKLAALVYTAVDGYGKSSHDAIVSNLQNYFCLSVILACGSSLNEMQHCKPNK